ncbi:spore germination protein gerkc [hydrocarbon metagenome]|uniref:Spore germination protein gerkc n=1 Tax=hydrocarbon metagenome TaxID=938273 RepID=A0A0W8E2A1_9ZZZZ
MRNKRLILVLLLLMFISITFSGCWNRREVQQLSIATGFGIDIVEVDGRSQFRLSVLALQTAEMAATGNTTQMGSQSSVGTARVISSYGDTIYDALRNWNLRSSRQLFLGHAWILVLGNSVTSEGLGQVLDFLNRHKDVRFRTMVVAYEGSAREALQAKPEFENMASLEIQQLILQNGPRVSKIETVDIFQLTYDLLTPGRELVLPCLQLITPPEEQSQAVNGMPSSENGPQNKVVRVTGSVVYRNYQPVGTLNVDQTQGMLFIKNEFKTGIIPISIFGQNYSILLRKASSKINLQYDQAGLTINVKIKGTGTIQEGGSKINEIIPERIEQYEEVLNQAVIRRCNDALAKSQQLRSDVFCFGDKIHRQDPKLWKEISEQWEEIYPGIDVNVSADFAIENYGPVK